jgi:hypothetical protein
MSSEQKEQPFNWMVALVPLSGDSVLRPRWREAILIANDATADEQRRLYETLREMKWLPPKARSAFQQALGSTLRKQKFDDEARRIMFLLHRVNKVKERIKKDGQRPKGGIHEAAHEEVAAGEGITVAALKKQLQRFRKGERSALEEIRKRAVRVKPSEKVAAHIRKREKRGK